MGKITYNSTDWLGHWFYSHVFEKRPLYSHFLKYVWIGLKIPPFELLWTVKYLKANCYSFFRKSKEDDFDFSQF